MDFGLVVLLFTGSLDRTLSPKAAAGAEDGVKPAHLYVPVVSVLPVFLLRSTHSTSLPTSRPLPSKARKSVAVVQDEKYVVRYTLSVVWL